MKNDNTKDKIISHFGFVLFAASLFILLLVMVSSVQNPEEKTVEFGQFIELVKEQKIKDVTFDGDKRIFATLKESKAGETNKIKTVGDTRSELYQKVLFDNGIIPSYRAEEKPSILLAIIINWIPLLLIFFVGFMFFKRLSGTNSRNSITTIKGGPDFGSPNTNVKFADVAGVDEAKEELTEIVDFLKSPQKFTELGGRLPKGALLIGPPGTGKTLLAKAVAGEAGVPFFSISGSQFVELFVGVGAGRVRNLFEQARKNAPCIIFIDEIDAIGKHRSNGPISGGNDEREQTLNQLLVEMDGFEASAGIIILAATNRMDTLDPALLRPGRFDRRVHVGLPDVKGRELILKTHARKVPVDETVNFELLAKGTHGMSGAELENLVNEAAIFAARDDKKTVAHIDFEKAKDKIIMGVERRSLVISDEEKRTTAYHEIGHTLISKLLKGMDTFHKVSIVPRGQALGVTQTVAEDNKLSLSKEKAENMICMLMGGRAAEELIFGHFTTGASNDLERASNLAKRMVCEWGMSDTFGARSFYDVAGSRYGEQVLYSSETLNKIEQEISNIVNRNYEKAKQILTENKELLIKLSEVLLQKETMDNEEVNSIMEGGMA